VNAIPSGPAAAAILAAGIGWATLGILDLVGHIFETVKNFLVFYNPSGPLSGATTMAIVIWLASWFVLNLRWRTKNVAFGTVSVAAFAALALGLLLTFPPFVDLLHGE
jgi:hypothetical protein